MEGCRGQLHKGQCGTKPPKALEQYDAKNKRQIQIQKSKYKYKTIAQKSYSKAPQVLKQYDAKYGEGVYTIHKYIQMKSQQWKKERNEYKILMTTK